MQVRERFLRTMDFREVDRLPMLEWASWWDKTVARWKTEGLVIPKRAGLSVSFGLSLDAYICATNGGWYFPPVRGKRITHLEDNLRQATECADE